MSETLVIKNIVDAAKVAFDKSSEAFDKDNYKYARVYIDQASALATISIAESLKELVSWFKDDSPLATESIKNLDPNGPAQDAVNKLENLLRNLGFVEKTKRTTPDFLKAYHELEEFMKSL